MTHHADPYVMTKGIKEQENEQCQHHLRNMSVPVNHSRQRGRYHGQYRREHRKERIDWMAASLILQSYMDSHPMTEETQD